MPVTANICRRWVLASLLVVFCILWVQSDLSGGWLRYGIRHGDVTSWCGVDSSQDIIIFQLCNITMDLNDKREAAITPPKSLGFRIGNSPRRGLGGMGTTLADENIWRQLGFYRFPSGNQTSSSWNKHTKLHLVAIPYWAVVALLCLLIAHSFVPALRNRYRRSSLISICVYCGYDLRESPIRCQECGNLRRIQKGSEN